MGESISPAPARSRDLVGFALIVFVTVIAYLPSVLRLTYYRDDWYYMLDGLSAGPTVFHAMFEGDRPARGMVFAWLFSVFGASPLPYNFISFLLRLLSGLTAFWLFLRLWPARGSAALGGALLFVLYPGYLWWVAGIEYLPMMLSLLLQVVSITLTVVALQTRSDGRRWLYWSGAVMTGWAYLALVEYAIGAEVLRFLCVYIVVGQQRSFSSVGERTGVAVRSWLPSIIIPIGFLTWRLLVFENTRPATNLAAQFGVLGRDPYLTTLRWMVSFIRSATNVGLFAWGSSLNDLFYGLRLRDIGLGFAKAVAVVAGLAWLRWWTSRRQPSFESQPSEESQGGESVGVEMLSIGVLGLAAAVLPIVVTNRTVTFDAYSHYALPGSMAAAIAVVGLLQLIRLLQVRWMILAGLLAIATLTHHAVATRALIEQSETARFWQQVTWRVPDLKPGTTLFVKYPSFDYGGDGSIVWGPANLIYDASPSKVVPVRYEISALEVSGFILDEIASGANVGPVTYRTYTIPVDFGKVLVMSQSRPGTCVRVIDGRWPLLSVEDPPEIALAAQYSRAEMIDVETHGATAPDWLFGPEPVHGWCYFFEKAELALQRGDFEEVVRLAEQAEQEDQSPNEGIEWMPFARAYARLGMVEEIRKVGSKVNVNPADRRQACHTLYENQHPGYELPAEMVPVIHDLFCN